MTRTPRPTSSAELVNAENPPNGAARASQNTSNPSVEQRKVRKGTRQAHETTIRRGEPHSTSAASSSTSANPESGQAQIISVAGVSAQSFLNIFKRSVPGPVIARPTLTHESHKFQTLQVKVEYENGPKADRFDRVQGAHFVEHVLDFKPLTDVMLYKNASLLVPREELDRYATAFIKMREKGGHSISMHDTLPSNLVKWAISRGELSHSDPEIQARYNQVCNEYSPHDIPMFVDEKYEFNSSYFRKLLSDVWSIRAKSYQRYNLNIAFSLFLIRVDGDSDPFEMMSTQDKVSRQDFNYTISFYNSDLDDAEEKIEEIRRRIMNYLKTYEGMAPKVEIPEARFSLYITREYIGSPIKIVDGGIAKELFNPTSTNTCVFDCLEYIGYPLTDTMKEKVIRSYKRKDFVGVPMSSFAQLFNMVDELSPIEWVGKVTPDGYVYEYEEKRYTRYIVLRIDAKGRTTQTVYFPRKSTHTDEPITTAVFLVHLNHMMTWGFRELEDVPRLHVSMFARNEKIKPNPKLVLDKTITKPLRTVKEMVNLMEGEGYFKMPHDKIYAWDVETATDENGKHIVTTVCVVRMDDVYATTPLETAKETPDGNTYRIKEMSQIEVKVLTFTGDNCMEEFIAFLVKLSDSTLKRINQKVKELEARGDKKTNVELVRRKEIASSQMLFFAHNGGRYDTFFLMEHMNSFVGKLTSIIPKNGYASITFSEVIDFRDSFKHMAGSLGKFLESMNAPVEFLKGLAPYKYTNKVSKEELKRRLYTPINIRETEGYWERQGKKIALPADMSLDMTDDEESDLDKFCESTGIPRECFRVKNRQMFVLNDHLAKYCARDCIGLAIVLNRYSYAMYKISKHPVTKRGCYPLNSISLPAFAYTVAMVHPITHFQLQELHRHFLPGVPLIAPLTLYRGQGHSTLPRPICMPAMCRRAT